MYIMYKNIKQTTLIIYFLILAKYFSQNGIMSITNDHKIAIHNEMKMLLPFKQTHVHCTVPVLFIVQSECPTKNLNSKIHVSTVPSLA